MKLFHKGIFLCLGFICAHGLSVERAEAALLYLDPPAADIFRGDTITLDVRIDTDEGECINTIDAVINYGGSVRAVDVSRGESILNLWVEDPKIDEDAHTISFAGGIPGGYCGRVAGDPKLSNVVAQIVFRSPGFSIGATADDKKARIEFSEVSQVLLHDGFGTRADLRFQNAELNLLDTPGSATDDSWTARVADDEIPPADFSILLSKDENAFSGNYFITFNTQDKQSGIDHYEVMEEPFDDFYLFKWGRADAPWITTESPYVLKDQSLNSTIRVKAVDKAGLETIAVLVPDVAIRSVSFERMIILCITGTVIVLLCIFIGYALWKRKQGLIKELEADEHESN